MILKPTFTNGKVPSGGAHIVCSRIPLSELSQIQQINLSAETIVALLNKKEGSYLWRQKCSLVWKECPSCHVIFLSYLNYKHHYCSRRCNGQVRGQEWKAHGHKGRAAWTDKSKASYHEKMSGERNPAWKGGVTYFKTHGNYKGVKYVRCPPDFVSMARGDGYVMEHRLLVAQKIGRPLLRTEVVHHSNHDPADNNQKVSLFANNRDHKLYEAGHPIKPLWQGSVKNDIPASSFALPCPRVLL